MEITHVTKDNIHQLMRYVDRCKTLNRYVKDNFSKKERAELSVAPIIDDLHSEIQRFEMEIQKYVKANVFDYVHNDMYLYGNENCCELSSVFNDGEFYLHVIGRGVKDKDLKIEYLWFPHKHEYDKEDISCKVSRCIYDSKEDCDIVPIKNVVYALIDGKLSEINVKQFHEIVDIYKEMKNLEELIVK